MKRDDNILEAAEALRREVGDDFTIDQLSSRVNISRATIYRRVGSKESLLQQLAQVRGESLPQRDTRQRILDAVPGVIGRHGFLAATMEQIAEAAGIGVATVYRHFGDKESLLRAFIEKRTPQAALRDLMMHPTADVEADLATFAQTVLEFLYQHRDLMRIVLAGNENERAYMNQLRAAPTRLRELVVAYFAAQIEAGRVLPVAPPQDLALAFVGSLFAFAAIAPMRFDAPIENSQHTAQMVARMFLRQIAAGKDEAHAE